MSWVLVLFIASASDGFVPEIIDIRFPDATACWNTGFTMKAADPKRIKFFNCEHVGKFAEEDDDDAR